MKNIKYITQYIGVIFLFTIYKIIGLKKSLKVSAIIFSILGPFFRSKNISKNNLLKVFPKLTTLEYEKIIKSNGSIMEKYLLNILLLNIIDPQRSLIIKLQLKIRNI